MAITLKGSVITEAILHGYKALPVITFEFFEKNHQFPDIQRAYLDHCIVGYICFIDLLCLYVYVSICLRTYISIHIAEASEASDLIGPRTLRIVPWDFLWGGSHSIPGRPEKKWKSWTHKLHQIAIRINNLLPFVSLNSGSLRDFWP